MQGKPDSVQDKSFILHERIRSHLMIRQLVTLKEAAEAMGVSYRHVQRLVEEANTIKQSRWRYGREIVNLSQKTALKRTLRINLSAVFAVDAL